MRLPAGGSWAWVARGLWVWVGLFLVLPVVSLWIVAFTGEPVNPLNALLRGEPAVVGQLLRSADIGRIGEILGTRRYQQALANSLVLSALVALLSTVLGAMVAVSSLSASAPGRRTWERLLPLPLATPPFLGAIALALLAGEESVLQHLLDGLGARWPGGLVYTFGGVALVQVVTLFPIVAMNVRAALTQIDPALDEAAATLGAPAGWRFFTVLLPLLRPALVAGFLLVFMLSLGDFGTPLILLPPRAKLLVVEVYKDMTGGLFWTEAAVLSLLILAVVFVALQAQRGVLGGRDYAAVGVRAGGGALPALGQVPRGAGWALASVSGVLFGTLLALMAGMVLLSVTASWGDRTLPDRLTWGYLEAVAFRSPRALGVTGLAALWTMGFSLVAGVLAAYTLERAPRVQGRSWLAFFLNLPLVVPGIVLAIGLIAAFNAPPLALHPTPGLLVAAYVLTRTPYVLKSVEAAIRQVPAALEHASASLGATPGFTFRHAVLPLLGPAAVAGAFFVYFSVTHDISLTLMLSPAYFIPASVSLYHELDSGRLSPAAAYGTVLFLATVVPYLWWSRRTTSST